MVLWFAHLQTVLLTPQTFNTARFNFAPRLYKSVGSAYHRIGSPVLHNNLPLHATPTTPENLPEILIVSQVVSVFPFRLEGQHPQMVNEANKDSLALRPAALPSWNLQHSITQILLHSATGVNEQFPGRDSNPLDKLPLTACNLGPAD